MSTPIFLLDVKVISHNSTDLPPAHIWEACDEFAFKLPRGNACSVLMYGRQKDRTSVCVRINEFHPYIKFRLKDNDTSDCNIRSIVSDMIDHVSGEKRAERLRKELKDNTLISSVETFQGYSTKGFISDESNPTQRKQFWYARVSFYSLEVYNTFQRATKHILHRAPMANGAIPVEVTHSAEQQFMHAVDIRPSSWFSFNPEQTSQVSGDEKISTCSLEFLAASDSHEYSSFVHPRQDVTLIAPDVRLMSIDIEVNGHQNIFPKAHDPHCAVSTVACMTAWSNDTFQSEDRGEETIIFYYTHAVLDMRHDQRKTWRMCPSEEAILHEVAAHVRRSDVDVITSHNGRTFDWPFMRERYHHIVLNNPDVDSLSYDARREYEHRVSLVTHMGRVPSIIDQVRYSTVNLRQSEEDEEDEEDVESTSRKRNSVQSNMNSFMARTSSDTSNVSVDGAAVQPEDDHELVQVKVKDPCIIRSFGIVDLDLYQYMLKDFANYDSYALGDLGSAIIGQAKIELSANELFKRLTSPTVEGLNEIGDYNARDVLLVLKIIRKRMIVPFLIQVANITHTCVSDVCSYGQQFRLSQFFVDVCRRYGFQFEQIGMHEYAQMPWLVGPYEGATVLPTVPCYIHKVYDAAEETPEEELKYDMVVTNDFNSLYPSIIQSLNLSPETLLLRDVHEQSISDVQVQTIARNVEMHEIHEPLIKHVYRVVQAKDDDSPYVGIMPRMVGYLLNARKEAKKDMKNHEKDSDEYVALDIRQNVFKIIANSIYGSLGAINQFGALSNRILARLVTFFGRRLIQIAKEEFLRIEGTSIVAGDTDSVMSKVKCKTLKEAIDIGEQVAHAINARLKADNMRHSKIAFEKAMKPALFLKQKMYAYMKYEDVHDIGGETSMGTMSKKRGTAELFKHAYSMIIRAVLLDPKDVSSEDVKRFALRIMRELFFVIDRAPIDSFSKTQSIRGDIKAYKTPSAACYAVQKLIQAKGIPWPQNDTRLALVTQYGTEPRVSKLACELEHFKELHAKGKAKLHYIKYIENVKGRFITLLDQIGIDGTTRMARALKAYATVLDPKQTNRFCEWRQSAETETSDAFNPLLPIDGSPLFIPKHARPKTYKDFLELRETDARKFKECQHELLNVSNPKMRAVMNAFNPDHVTHGDRRQQERCDKIAETVPTLPSCQDMHNFERWATGASSVTQSTAIQSVAHIDRTPFNAKRTERNCYADYDEQYRSQLNELRQTDEYKALIDPERQQAHARLNYVAHKMSVGRIVDYKNMINKRMRV